MEGKEAHPSFFKFSNCTRSYFNMAFFVWLYFFCLAKFPQKASIANYEITYQTWTLIVFLIFHPTFFCNFKRLWPRPISWHSTVPKRRSSFTVTWVMRTSKKHGVLLMTPFGGAPSFSIKPRNTSFISRWNKYHWSDHHWSNRTSWTRDIPKPVTKELVLDHQLFCHKISSWLPSQN